MKRKLFSLFFAALISVSMWATEGALSGRFTINANGDRVVFSQGNLQYKDGTGWRFAEHQWDFIGAWNTSDWIDLFGWGTWGEGKNPLNTSTTDGDYSWSTDFNGTLTNAVSTGWYTPSTDIYNYIFNTRSTASGIRYAKAKVNDFEGVILLPDNWNSSIYALNNANSSGASYTSNVISLSDWTNQLEANGAVFIPRASMRDGASAGPGGDGHYWTTTPGYAMHITNSDLSSSYGYCYKYYGFAVRLVRSALEQDADGYYLIGSVDDWKDFATLVQTTPTANAKMTADIDLGNDQTMIGSNNTYPYSGIFDGQGHTLTVAYNNTDAGLYVAPFSYIYGATIRNLHVAGTIQTACQNAGVVSKYGGSGNVVENVWSSLAIQTNWTVNGGIWECCSGLIGSTLAGTNASLIMRDCLFTGSVVATSGDQSGCFMGYVDSNCSANVSNCLSVGTYSYTATNSSVTRDRMSIDNSFVKQFPNAIPAAMQLTNERLADGSIAYKLQNNRTDLVWGQRIGIDAEPVLTNDESYRVYISKNGGYTNDPDEAMQQDGEGYFLLGSLQDWRAFAELINSGMNTANAKMTADINLGDDQTMIGLGSVDGQHGDGNLLYTGIFDGQGHTLTINYVTNERFVAPFRHVQDATIKNLRVAGTITTNNQFAAGIVGACYGQNRDNYITNCISSVNIVSSWENTADTYLGGSLIGGIIGKLCYFNRLHISDCIFNGSISGENRSVAWGGFVGLPDGTIIVRNSLQTAEFNCTNVLVGSNGSGTFSSRFGGGAAFSLDVDASNYYLNALGSVQGTQATAEQLADGTIATALQAGRAEEIWVQEGTTPMLKLFASEITPVEPTGWENGVLPGKFSINADGDQVFFSQGNLQYQASPTPIWRFATNQYDMKGWGNENISDTYNDWIDLFGWGTANNPTNTSQNNDDYSVFTDWGTNAISNGGNTANMWRTMTNDEWYYLLKTRENAASLQGLGTVAGVQGAIFLPDNWVLPDGASFVTDPENKAFTDNVYTAESWSLMENAGAVFLPRAFRRFGTTILVNCGYYWSSSQCGSASAFIAEISSGNVLSTCGNLRLGFSVRLVRSALEQDADGYYLLGSVDDWKDFATLVQTNPTANAKMTADINLGNDQTMIGSLSVPYAGIFDGQGYTLTVAYNQSDIKQGIGPFYVLGAATIQNLHVDGSMLTRCGIGGVAGIVKGNATIQRCWVSATLQSNGYNPNPRGTLGGICSVLEGVDDAHLIIEDCLFDGTIVDNEFCGGFMSHVERASCSVTMRRGLNIGTYPTTTNENGTFIREVLSGVRNLEASTLFHKKVFGKAQGTQVTDEQLANGVIAYNLQANRTDLVWGQRLGTDAEPVLTNDESYRVYISKNGGYTNNPEDAYEGLQQDGEGNYLLGCLLDWQEFAELVKTTPTANAKMTADINLDDDQTTIGNPGETTYNYFKGTFDGQGHTLTVHYVKQGDKDIRSPFPNISEATIKNIHITGTIESSTACQPAVIGCVRNGTSTIENVWSSVELTSTKSSWCEASGLVGCVDGYRNGNLVMTDCMISGNIISSGSYEGCFIGYINSGGSATVSNCMSVANFTYSGTSGFQGNYTNCYVKQFPSSIPAVMQVTDAQLADGTTTTALQAGRAEEIWVQDPVTNQPMLKIFATTPIEAITANEDPDHAGVYYSTFYDSAKKYALPNDGTEAYAAEVNDGAMYLHKIAEGNDVLPAGTAVIFKATSGTITLTESDDAPVAISVTNHLHGVDVDTEISSAVSGTCYVLSGGSNGVGFYLYEYPNQLKAHKAYIDLNGGGAAQAPKHLRFVFDSATAIETTDADVKAEKRIENGVLYIIKNGVKYNAQGQTVK